MARFICIEGPARGAVFPLTRMRLRIGRDADCDVRIRDSEVSRHHAEVELSTETGHHRIVDAESRNGIRVNGLPLPETLLAHGDEVAIGATVLVYDDETTAPGEGLASGAVSRSTVFRRPSGDAPLARAAGLPQVRSTSLVGKSPAMQEVYRLVAQAASADLPVLIRGESGTGKELVARALHANSDRRAEPFVPVNCANLSATLLESELFGHEKGAFTGAVERRMGRFEVAGAGTIFLDEIGETEPGLQARLLRVLAEKEFTRVGGHDPIRSEARVLTATHRDLEAAIRAGAFREDLFYRLHVVPIDLPPLRARTEDLPDLLEHFVAQVSGGGRPIERFDDDAIAALAAYAWPGNIRELRNLVERLAILTDGPVIGIDDLPPELLGRPAERTRPIPRPGDRDEFPTLAELERDHLVRAMERAEGNKSTAARLLGIERSTLYSKLKRHGIEAGPA